jgi:protein phosphatase
MRYGARTCVGILREQNQDSFLTLEAEVGTKRDEVSEETPELVSYGLYIVADGMGGAAAGDKASADALEVVLGAMAAMMGRTHVARKARLRETPEHLAEAIRRANQEIFRAGEEDTSLEGMGTTITAAAAHDGILHIAQVGDSRLYRLREGEFAQLTTDHSVVQEMVDAGRITKERARTHPLKNQITRAVGPEPECEVDVTHDVLQEGDLYLLCSDGLWEMVEDAAIEEIVKGCQSNEETRGNLDMLCEALVAKACDEGGRDNITVLLLETEATDVRENAETEMLLAAPTKLDRPKAPLGRLDRTLTHPRTSVFVKD